MEDPYYDQVSRVRTITSCAFDRFRNETGMDRAEEKAWEKFSMRHECGWRNSWTNSNKHKRTADEPESETSWLWWNRTNKGWFTLWTMKSDQGVVRALIGCWTCPGIISVYTKEQMAAGPWRSRSPKYSFQDLVNALTWSNGFCSERGKRSGMVGKARGPWGENYRLQITDCCDESVIGQPPGLLWWICNYLGLEIENTVTLQWK